jgi:selenocysteine lyase/cysteine desulfurase
MTDHRGRGYLDTPSMGLPPEETVAAMQEAVAAWGHGSARYPEWEATMERCRLLYAELVGVAPEDVGLLGSVVPAVAAAAATLARGRGMVVAHRAEFRSLLLPVLAHVAPERMRWVDGPYRADTFTAVVDEHTDAVLLSAISSHDGGRPALSRLAAACDSVGADLLVDGTQAVGIVVPDVDPSRLGLLAVAGYKGLRGPRGIAYATARPHVVEHPTTPSPYGMADADRQGSYGPPLVPKPGAAGLDQSPAWLSWVGARPALSGLLAQSSQEREAYVLGLASRLREHLAGLGLEPQESDLPSPIISFAVAEPERVLCAMERAGVRAASRRGRIRTGVHVYNDESDVDLLAQVLADCGATHPTSAIPTASGRPGNGRPG